MEERLGILTAEIAIYGGFNRHIKSGKLYDDNGILLDAWKVLCRYRLNDGLKRCNHENVIKCVGKTNSTDRNVMCKAEKVNAISCVVMGESEVQKGQKV